MSQEVAQTGWHIPDEDVQRILQLTQEISDYESLIRVANEELAAREETLKGLQADLRYYDEHGVLPHREPTWGEKLYNVVAPEPNHMSVKEMNPGYQFGASRALRGWVRSEQARIQRLKADIQYWGDEVWSRQREIENIYIRNGAPPG